MTIPMNAASGEASVGVQAGAVHGDVYVYQLADDAPIEQRYRVGVCYLDGGMPTEAQQLISEAIMNGHATNEAYFHWLLALLSGRTLHQLSQDDLYRLNAARKRSSVPVNDEWADGVRMIIRLLDSAETTETDLRLVVKELDELPVTQRTKILQHLDMVLSGPIENQLWERALNLVKAERMGNGRLARSWIFFQPAPVKPRIRPPAPKTSTTADWIRAIIATAFFGPATGELGWLLLERGMVLALLPYLMSIAAGCICCVTGVEWRFRAGRLRAKEEEHRRPAPPVAQAPPGGFADQVDQLFSRYFLKYQPAKPKRAAWRTDTAGVRKYLRDEIVSVYRETGVSAGEIAWLIRYQLSDVTRRWQDGTLWDYRKQWRTPATTKAAFVLGLVLLCPSSCWAIGSAIRATPLAATITAVVLAVSGWAAAGRWLHIVLERRRYETEHAENEQRRVGAEAAYDRWQLKLAPRPSDTQMAAWLDYDRKYLTDHAMRHYKLAPSNVIAHASIEAPAGSHERARVRSGPWRYSRYRILVFLLTTDGVRQLTADLDFRKGTFHDWRRISYRFDAVAAVEVTETDRHQRTFELTLVNGQPIQVPVTESDTDVLLPGENSETLSNLALDAAGLTNTLHVLEGVAAEGKGWIEHENQRKDNRLKAFTAADPDATV